MSGIHWSVSDEEIATARNILAKLQPGYLPLEIFLQFARLAALSVVEIVPLRVHSGAVQILLLERDNTNGPLWPSHTLHTPGTVVRPTDHEGDFGDAFRRIIDGELGGIAVRGEPQYVETIFHKNERGMEHATVYYADVTGSPTAGRFYNANDLPATVMASQVSFIKTAVRGYRADHSTAFIPIDA